MHHNLVSRAQFSLTSLYFTAPNILSRIGARGSMEEQGIR